jgi:D-alanine transaminase
MSTSTPTSTPLPTPAAHGTDLPTTLCYLNGAYTALRDAKISVMDRGFVFGDGVYEVVPVYAGAPFRFSQHMARLDRSLAELRISNPLSHAEWHAITQQLVADFSREAGTATPPDQLIYIQVTRGVALRDHVMTSGVAPTVFVMTNLMKPVPAAHRAAGVACVSADDFRWEKAHIKSTSLLGAVFSRQISADVGAIETVMFRGGYLSEAAASNVWVVQDGCVLGTPKDHLVLEGIRYGLIEELCSAAGLGFELRRISRAEVFAADELLLSSATKEILPITRLDGLAVGSGQPGPAYAKLYAGYQRAKAQPTP